MTPKATLEEIRARFDNDVERFADLNTGQMTTVDAPLVLELLAKTAARVTPGAKSLVDLGCGAGNFSLKLGESLHFDEITLVDLSRPMLDRACSRLRAATTAELRPLQTDLLSMKLRAESADMVVAAAVLHHLRAESEWKQVFRHVWAALRPGGSFWIWDLIHHDIVELRELMWHRYGEYLAALKGEAHRDHVLAYVAREDTPRSLPFQLAELRAAGFREVDVIHKNGCFAAFGAVK